MKPSSVASGVRSSWLALATKSCLIRSLRFVPVMSVSVRTAAAPSEVGGLSGAHLSAQMPLDRARQIHLDRAAVAPREHGVGRLQHRRSPERGTEIAPGEPRAQQIERRAVGADDAALRIDQQQRLRQRR